ncbi:efflux RND transporter permease subunit [Henriciella marina]|uniref:Efflux RND transporter permease subunit n=1 Tax=Henriciella marina TaxID=453851 RepID=A0ABT4LTP5_9PROT|nr:efflux RND transporter permease subunit [Henriciella marina]MCZ4297578.1 efflux RND transporter permease subunit [Henriciella marina]
MSGLVAWWARNGIAANLLMVIAFIGGTFGFLSLEKEAFPAGDWNGASVSIAWPGASPQDVEDQIVVRLEEVVADIDGLKRLTGVAREGVGYVNLQTELDVDVDEFVDEVKRRVDTISNLPQSSFPPQVSRWSANNQFMGLALHGNVDPGTLDYYADEMRDRIALLEGGELAQVQGTLGEEVSIEVSEAALRRYNMTFSEVANAVRGSSINSSGGTVRTDTGTVAIQARQLADTREDFENIVIRQTAEFGTIRIRDVANVVDGFVDGELDATYNGEPTAFIMVNQPEKMDIVLYSDNIKDFIERANSGRGQDGLPEGLRLDLLFDMSEVYRGRMDTISSAALQGMALVLIILILFLRPIVAFWVTIGIGTAFAGGIMILPLFGVSLNFLSLFAVLLVIGVVVDDAIVVGENIHKEVESGRREGLGAATVGTQLVMKPVIFGVLTTMIMFAPWAFIPGPERQFTAQITYVVVAALAFSLIESMFILPSHLSHMKPQKFGGPVGRLMSVQQSIADSLITFANRVYKPLLEYAVKFRYVTVAIFTSLFVIAIMLVQSNIVPFRFMPQIEDDLVQVRIDLPDGSPQSRSLQVRDQLRLAVEQSRQTFDERYPELGDDHMIRDISIVATEGDVQSWIGLIPPQDRPEGVSTKEIADEIRANFGEVPDAEEVNFQFTINNADNSIRYALNNDDLDVLRQAADDVKAQIATYEQAFDIGDNLSSAAQEIRIDLKPGATSLGITLGDVTSQVRAAYYGIEAQRLPRDGDDVRVMVRYPKETRESVDSLRDLRIRTSDGREIPLEQVAEISFAPGIDRIQRRERMRSVTVFADLVGDSTRATIFADMEQNFWPDFAKKYPTVTRGAVGDIESEQEFVQDITRLYIIAFVSMYILLAIAFQSYSQPLLLMLAIPFGYAGAVFGHWGFDTPMALFSMFGIGAAAGVVINDNLVLVDYINRRREEGAGALQAIVDAGVSRFRPVLLTSVTTFVGILPMIAQKSVQAQFLKPMVVSLGSAVAFALFVSLLLVPAFYAVGCEVGRIFRWTWGGRPYRQIGESYEGEANIDEEELIGTSRGARPQPAE